MDAIQNIYGCNSKYLWMQFIIFMEIVLQFVLNINPQTVLAVRIYTYIDFMTHILSNFVLARFVHQILSTKRARTNHNYHLF